MAGRRHVAVGDRVLDVAAGAGEQSLRIARRVGPGGHVLVTDIAPELLARAARDAAAEGLDQVTTQELDGETVDSLPPGSFDAVVSHVGLIYFPDQQRALQGMRQSLRSGGRLAAVVYSTPGAHAFFSIPIGIIRSRAQLPAPAPSKPGPFSLGSPGVLETALEDAGFVDVEVRAVLSPVVLPSAAECVTFQKESFLHQMMRTLTPAEKEHTWQEIIEALRQFEGPAGFVGPCEMLVGAGTAQAGA